MIFTDFEIILVPEDNGKQNNEVTYTNFHQKHVVCSYCYKLACVDDKYNKTFKLYLGEDTVYKFVNRMVQESKCYSEVMKKHFKQKSCNG